MKNTVAGYRLGGALCACYEVGTLSFTLMKASAFGEVQENAASSRANDNVL